MKYFMSIKLYGNFFSYFSSSKQTSNISLWKKEKIVVCFCIDYVKSSHKLGLTNVLSKKWINTIKDISMFGLRENIGSV